MVDNLGLTVLRAHSICQWKRKTCDNHMVSIYIYVSMQQLLPVWSGEQLLQPGPKSYFRSQARQDAVKITSPMLGNSDLCTPTWHRHAPAIKSHLVTSNAYDIRWLRFMSFSNLKTSWKITDYIILHLYNYIKLHLYFYSTSEVRLLNNYLLYLAINIYFHVAIPRSSPALGWSLMVPSSAATAATPRGQLPPPQLSAVIRSPHGDLLRMRPGDLNTEGPCELWIN